MLLELFPPDPGREDLLVRGPTGSIPGRVTSKHAGLYGRKCYYVATEGPLALHVGGQRVEGRLLSLSGEAVDIPPQLDYLARDLWTKGEAFGRATLVQTLNPPMVWTPELLHESDALAPHLRDFVALGSVRVTLRRSDSPAE